MTNLLEKINMMFELDESEYTDIIELPIDIPKEIKEIYNLTYDYFYNTLMRYRENVFDSYLIGRIMDPKFDGYMLPDTTYDEKTYGPYHENLRKYLRQNIKIAGGAISDVVINHYLSKDTKINDIDIFIDMELFSKTRDILSEQLIAASDKEAKDGEPHFEFAKRLLIEDIFKSESVEDVDGLVTIHHHYDHEIVKEVFKTTYKNMDIDFVAQSPVGRSVKDALFSFDLYFRAFSYDGQVVRGTQRGLNDIKNKRITVQNTSSPAASLFRIANFQKRYGFKTSEVEKMLLFYRLFSFNSEWLNRFYHYYATDDERALKDFIEEQKNYSVFKDEIIVRLEESVRNKTLSKKEFFVQYFMCFIESVAKYNPVFKGTLEKELVSFYHILEDNEHLRLYQTLNTTLGTDVGKFKNKIYYFIENNIHQINGMEIDLKDFNVDYNDIVKGNKYYLSGELNEEFFQQLSGDFDAFSLQRQFDADLKSFRDYVNEQRSNHFNVNDFVSSQALNYIIDIKKFQSLIESNNLTKETAHHWYHNALTTERLTLFGIASSQAKVKIILDAGFFTDQRFDIIFKYLDDYGFVKDYDNHSFSYEPSFSDGIYFIDPKLAVDINSYNNYYSEYFPEPWLEMRLDGEQIKLHSIPPADFMFLNGNRARLLEQTISDALIKVSPPKISSIA